VYPNPQHVYVERGSQRGEEGAEEGDFDVTKGRGGGHKGVESWKGNETRLFEEGEEKTPSGEWVEIRGASGDLNA